MWWRMDRIGRRVVTAICFAFLLVSFAPQAGKSQVSEYPAPLTREAQTIVVNGRPEVWRLQWKAKPKPYCEAASNEWYTCPCLGFAYGETGNLFLTRSVNGAEIDRLHITPFFEGETDVPVLQRWKPDEDKDLKPGFKSADNLAALVVNRPVVQIMHFADYDHDGSPTEFYLQTATQPCFHTYGMVVGVSRKNPRLHAFGTASHPDEPLAMDRSAWEALRKASGPTEVTVTGCGDHGSEAEITLRLHWTADGIDGTRREYTCPPEVRRLVAETPLSQE